MVEIDKKKYSKPGNKKQATRKKGTKHIVPSNKVIMRVIGHKAFLSDTQMFKHY